MRVAVLVLALTMFGCASDSVHSMFAEHQNCSYDRVTVAREPAPAWAVDDLSKRRFFFAQGCGQQKHYMCDVPIDVEFADGRSGTGHTCVVATPPPTPYVEKNEVPNGLDFIMTAATDTEHGQLAVHDVRPGSEAARVGFLKNDIVLEIDHQKVDPNWGTIRVIKMLQEPTQGGHLLHVQRGSAVFDLTIGN